jgi:hypothetical protein
MPNGENCNQARNAGARVARNPQLIERCLVRPCGDSYRNTTQDPNLVRLC